MLLCRSETNFIAISQPAHAWLSGRLAEAWGNDAFSIPPPRDSVTCAAALHDIGWFDWERAPRIDPSTGYPLRFQDVPAEEHTRLWSSGVERASEYGDLVALFVSRHGHAIYEKTFDFGSARPAAVDAVQAFISSQLRYQKEIIERVTAGQPDASYMSEQNLQRVKDFIVAVDTMSLHLCWGIQDRAAIRDVPTRGNATETLEIKRLDDHAITVDPWPFTAKHLSFSVEGKLLEQPSRNQDALDHLLRTAPRVTLRFDLRQS